MSSRCALWSSVLLVVFSGLVIATQLLDFQSKRLGPWSIIESFHKGKVLAQTSGIAERGGGVARRLDLVFPENARVFLTGMTGPTNGVRLGQYYYLAYYLFPREVAVTLDPPRFTPDGIQGRTTDSDEEMQENNFDVRLDPGSNGKMQVKGWHVSSRVLANPDWFGSWSDTIKAGLLPLLTALSGVWLLRALFAPGLLVQMRTGEQLACGLGLGMMAVAALTLGVKLCGFHGHGWVFVLVAAGSIFELWRDGRALGKEIGDGLRTMAAGPIATAILIAGAMVFFILFRLAGLQGIVEFDGAANWLFKAKILFFSTGRELVGYFSNPRLAYAHLDYPTLVPSLHAATFDSLGHVDEFVTKFWPAWMLLFLLLILWSLGRAGGGRRVAVPFFLLGVLLLPFTQAYVQMEGATLPMVFFAVLGLVQCALGLAEQNRARLGLGLTLLFGAAMTKFEGAIFLALAAGWMLALPGARRLLKPSPACWRIAAFCFLAALPFVCLRAQIPVLHYESRWTSYVLAHPGATISNAPKIFLILLARLFLAPTVARWSAGDGQLHWTGQWDGWSSLYDHMTLGLPWLSLLLTMLVWVAAPARRPVIFWTLAVFFSAMMAISVVFASFVSLSGLDNVVSARASDDEAGRYLVPLLLAWTSVMVTLIFRDPAPPTTVANASAGPAASPDAFRSTDVSSATPPSPIIS